MAQGLQTDEIQHPCQIVAHNKTRAIESEMLREGALRTTLKNTETQLSHRK